MLIAFYLAAAVALAATVMVITQLGAVHALLYLIVSQLAVAVIFYVLGAPFVAALEVIIYAGAIVVLFVFVVMMLNLGEVAADQERQWLHPRMWIGPGILAAILLGELLYMLGHSGRPVAGTGPVEPQQVGLALFGPYLLAVELAAMLLLAGLIGAYHLGRQQRVDAKQGEGRYDLDSHRTRVVPRGEPVRSGADGPAGAS
jgi:NADH-quinone oxidoreductase subunit J